MHAQWFFGGFVFGFFLCLFIFGPLIYIIGYENGSIAVLKNKRERKQRKSKVKEEQLELELKDSI